MKLRFKARTLKEQLERVVRSDNCSGCGACAQLHQAISMSLDDSGFMRPQWSAEHGAVADRSVTEAFGKICPGVGVVIRPAPASRIHPTMGPYLSVWEAWAVDPEVRYAGSSGGVLTALSQWLIDSGRASAVVGAGSSPVQPDRTVALTLTTKSEVLSAAGSRYAPVSNAALPVPASGAFVGKPCEVSALRALSAATPADEHILMSFFCAGVPSQHATTDLIRSLKVDPESVTELRYRGKGWPGSFVVADSHGQTGHLSYEQSWGDHLGKQLQSRCKICPDGTGGHADIAAGDFWRTDSRGYPLFDDNQGVSAVVARTARGQRLLMEARDAGIIELSPIEMDAVAAVQPLQTTRRRTLLGRLWGRRLASRMVPRFRGFALTALAVSAPRESIRFFRGSFRRARSEALSEKRRRSNG